MKTKKQILFFLLSCILLITTSVCGVLAYFTAIDSAENVFVFGKIEATLDESKVDRYGRKDISGERVAKNDYVLLPGLSYNLDPTVHIIAGSEDCYVFVTVDNPIQVLESTEADYRRIETQLSDNGWSKLMNGSSEVTHENLSVYVHEGNDTEDPIQANVIQKDTANNTDLLVFELFSLDEDSIVQGTKPNNYDGSLKFTGDYDGSKINVNVYAVQAEGFSDALEAWSAVNPSLSSN